ncbi:MAG: DUF6159 family protein [Candidatus Pacebacteria bacterium]|jgi:hypothetical protein|nr:DUF6159 family protein [Candidatus Paceibacterota bacterium]
MATENTIIPTQNVPAAKKIGRIKGGYMIAIESVKILSRNKSIMLFPLLALISGLLVAAVFAVGYLVIYGGTEGALEGMNETSRQAIFYAALFVFYVIASFITAFFEIGLVTMVSGQIRGRKVTFSEGMRAASARTGKILFWSLTAATVGVVLQLISDKSKMAGKIVSSLIGFAWGVATFFIVPVLALENETVIGSIKRSGGIFKNKWGEAIIANFSTGLFFSAILILGLVVFLVFAFLVAPATPVLVVSAGALVVFILTVIIASQAVEGIYRTIIYEYAANNVIYSGFPQELVVNAIKK